MNAIEALRIVEGRHLKAKAPEFKVGDTVDVSVKILEGDGKDAKERVQVYSGTVIARKGTGINASFTVRRIVNNEGVERIFMLHSPKVGDVVVRRSGFTRRAKLYYLRNRVGKSTKLREVKADEAALAAGKAAKKAAKAERIAAAAAAAAAPAPAPAPTTNG